MSGSPSPLMSIMSVVVRDMPYVRPPPKYEYPAPMLLPALFWTRSESERRPRRVVRSEFFSLAS